MFDIFSSTLDNFKCLIKNDLALSEQVSTYDIEEYFTFPYPHFHI